MSIALLAFGLSGCARSGGSNSLDAIARDYVHLVAALGERDPDGVDYNIAGDPSAGQKTPRLPEIAASARQLETRLQTVPDAGSERGRFLAGQLHALAARAEVVLGKRESFDKESTALFGFAYDKGGATNPASIRASLEKKLPGSGTLTQRIADFQSRSSIPVESLPSVITAALAACREATTAHLSLPAGESVSVEYVTDKPWSAYSTYQGGYRSVIRVNVDFALTVDAALDLACHEGYPGHHAFNSMVEQNLVRGGGREEFRVQPTFSPQSLVSEAAAGVAPELAFRPEERLRLETNTLYPLAKLDAKDAATQFQIRVLLDSLSSEEASIARDYIDGSLEFVRAASALEDRALMAHTEATLRYLNEFRTYAVTYTSGRDAMRRWMENYSGGAWSALIQLTKHPVFPANAPATAGGG